MTIYDKTEKGREEIATRKHQLSTRIRSMLVLIDGRTPDEDLIRRMAGLGLDASHLQTLADEGYIHRKTRTPINVDMPLHDEFDFVNTEQPDPNSVIDLHAVSTLQDLEDIQTICGESETTKANDDLQQIKARNKRTEIENNLIEELERNQGVYSTGLTREQRLSRMKDYISQQIKEHVGLKAYFLQRRVQKAQNLKDLHDIRFDFVAAILKAKGKDVALSVRDHFDRGIYSRFSVNSPEFLD